MLSNNSIVSVFSKDELVAKDGHTYGYRCNISQSYAKKDNDGNVVLDENGRKVYVKDFSGYVKFLGNAAEFIKDKNIVTDKPLRIRVDNMGIKSFTIDKEVNGETKKQYYTDILVFGASELSANTTHKNSEKSTAGPMDDDELPFD